MKHLHQHAKNLQHHAPEDGGETDCLQTPDAPCSAERLPLDLASLEQHLPFLLELFAAVSHEFRTPLTVITLATSTLQRRAEQLSKPEQQEWLQMIERASQCLQTLTTRMLHLAQIELGVLPLERSSVRLPTLVQEAISRATQQLPPLLQRRITFLLRCQDERGNATGIFLLSWLMRCAYPRSWTNCWTMPFDFRRREDALRSSSARSARRSFQTRARERWNCVSVIRDGGWHRRLLPPSLSPSPGPIRTLRVR